MISLQQHLNNYLTMRRALGFTLLRGGKALAWNGILKKPAKDETLKNFCEPGLYERKGPLGNELDGRFGFVFVRGRTNLGFVFCV
jgi:hypothetical protein